jgi:ABC-2 type transport system permease protein
MKKLYNKALLYQYYHSGKWALFLGSLIFAFTNYVMAIHTMDTLKLKISSLAGDRLSRCNVFSIILELFVLFIIYILITGINKRNNLTFLTSGPYSKEDIKKNQIVFLCISLIILTLIFVYINLCIFYKERDVLILSEDWASVLVKDTVRLFICGLAFISYLVLMDTLFSNSGITLFLIVFTPIVFIADTTIILYIGDAFKSYSILNGKCGQMTSEILTCIKNYLFSRNVEMLTNTSEVVAIILILFSTAFFFFLTWIINKKLIINNINKFFNFLIVEKIFYWVFVFSIIILISSIVVSTLETTYIIQDMYFYREQTLKGTIITVLLLSAIGLVSTFIERFIRKLMKKFI